MSTKRFIVLLAVVTFIVGFASVFVVDRAFAICSGPPDYAGCNKAQVESIAKNHRKAWFKHHEFGRTNDVLGALSSAHASRVKAATRLDLRQGLRQKARHQSKAASTTAVFTTGWRGRTYSVRSFPYHRYVNLMFNPPGHPSCWANGAYSDYAYRWCAQQGVPTGWDYWLRYARTVSRPGPQEHMVCGKEIVIGATGGAATGAVAGIWTGPGAGLGAAIGALSTGFGVGVGCAVNHLGKQAGWWN
jgi:hypothetical protein